jgi:hypothetical protein
MFTAYHCNLEIHARVYVSSDSRMSKLTFSITFSYKWRRAAADDCSNTASTAKDAVLFLTAI